jgi:hypothetical protein
MAAFTRREARRKFPMKGFGILGRDHVLHRHRRFPALSILRCEHTTDRVLWILRAGPEVQALQRRSPRHVQESAHLQTVKTMAVRAPRFHSRSVCAEVSVWEQCQMGGHAFSREMTAAQALQAKRNLFIDLDRNKSHKQNYATLCFCQRRDRC